MSRVAWSDEQVESLKKMHAEGLTLLVISEILGFTRNAVAGACHRHKLKRRDMTARKPKTKSKGSGRPRKTGHEARFSRFFGPSIHANPKAIVVRRKAGYAEEVAEPAPLNLTLLDLTNRSCRWATTATKPHLFCGHPTLKGQVWCAHHYGRVFE